MSDHRGFGPYPYGHALTDVFLDVERGTINFEYFRGYFDQVSLPMEIAKASLGDQYSQYELKGPGGCVRFVPLSTLRKYKRFPPYQDVRDALVDHTAIDGFTLSGPLSMWHGKNILARTPCVFISHRWQSPDEPDPDGAHLAAVLERLSGVSGRADRTGFDVFLWIDYCCLPQREGPKSLSAEDEASLQAGLAFLSEIVKSCDLMILHSPDYIGRVWCYTELFVWLTKIAEIGDNLTGRPLYDSILTRHADAVRVAAVGERKDILPLHSVVNANMKFRGYGETTETLIEIYRPIFDYTAGAIDSAGYTLGAFEAEYVPHLVRFMCNSWYLLQQKQCAIPEDKAICLRVIVKALKFANTALSG